MLKKIMQTCGVLLSLTMGCSTVGAENKPLPLLHVPNKLVPRVRIEPLAESAPPALHLLASLVLRAQVLESNEFAALPIVLGSDDPERLSYSVGDMLYVQGLQGVQLGSQVAIYTKYRGLREPLSGEFLGEEVRFAAAGLVRQLGSLSRIELTNSSQPVYPLDRVVSVIPRLGTILVSHLAPNLISGQIIALDDALSSTAQGHTLVINRGARDQVAVGQVFNVSALPQIDDPSALSPEPAGEITLPPQKIGEILIYQVYNKVSFALVTHSTRIIPLHALVQSAS